jgi:hypothetical protein
MGISLYAKIAPLSLFASMLSETPGTGKSLSYNVPCPWPACWYTQSAYSQTFTNISGLWGRFRAYTLHLVELPMLIHTGSGRLDLPYPERLLRQFFMVPLSISFTTIAQSLVNVPHGLSSRRREIHIGKLELVFRPCLIVI